MGWGSVGRGWDRVESEEVKGVDSTVKVIPRDG